MHVLRAKTVAESHAETTRMARRLFVSPPASRMILPILAFSVMESFLLVYPALDAARVAVGAIGIVLPAYIAGLATVPVAERLGGRMYLRRSFLLVFVGLMIVGAVEVVTITGLTVYAISAGVTYTWQTFRIDRVAVLGYGAVLWVREVILSATSNSKYVRSLPAASLHPVLGLVGLALFFRSGPSDIVLDLAVFVLFFLSAVAYAEIAKRPLMRSFGADGLKLLRSTLDQYSEQEEAGIKELEAFFDSISVRARVRVGGVVFRGPKGIKAILLAPTVHPGPMGYVSGSDLPSKVARGLAGLTPNVLVAHGPTTHDENPATSAEVERISEAVRESVAPAEFGPKVGRACRASFRRASALAQAYGDIVLIVASFAPNPTDDIDSATGYAAVQEARLAGARDAVFVDAHNCHEPGVGLTLFGSERSHEIIEAAKAATEAALEAPKDRIRIGYGARRGFATPDQGIGARGIEVLVVETGDQRTAYILFDGNNMVPGIRDAIRARVAGLVQESEAMTTDNHSVNLTMDGFNAVGAVLDRETILTQAEGAVREAIANLEDSEAAAFAVEIPNFRIFGPQSASRLTTSINSTMAVLRPALYVTLSGAIALGALVIVLF
jgi:putative membrane protein